MINQLKKLYYRPKPYEPSTSKFWDDPYISKKMLEAHLNPNWEAATRKPDDVLKITNWIFRIKNEKNLKLLDLGCGPGLYAIKFYDLGFDVTGVDLSPRSIAYAKDRAIKKKLPITYINMNYLDLDVKEAFDVITLIYCDYSVLAKEDRIKLLRKIKQALKPDGVFIFDVFTPNQYDGVIESKSWYIDEKDGFWTDQPHLVLENHYIYENDLHLNQSIVINLENHIEVYRIWDQTFTKDTIIKELEIVGFDHIDVYSDLSGTPYDQNSKLLGIVVYRE